MPIIHFATPQNTGSPPNSHQFSLKLFAFRKPGCLTASLPFKVSLVFLIFHNRPKLDFIEMVRKLPQYAREYIPVVSSLPGSQSSSTALLYVNCRASGLPPILTILLAPGLSFNLPVNKKLCLRPPGPVYREMTSPTPLTGTYLPASSHCAECYKKQIGRQST